MSTYYDFYVAVKEDDKYKVIAPYYLKDGEMTLTPMCFFSHSNIGNILDDFNFKMLDVSDIHEDSKKEFVHHTNWGGEDKDYCTSFVIPLSEIESVDLARNHGIKNCFIPKSKLKMLIDNNYAVEEYTLDTKSADELLEMTEKQRERWCRASFIETNSVGAIAHTIMESVPQYLTWDIDKYYVFYEVS